jgi:hypothetical protein
VNALLNYLFALLEVEAILGCHAMGLDVGMAPIHADVPSRPSLAFDVVEATRPATEAHALAIIEARTFTRRDFHERRNGVGRLSPLLAHEMAETLPRLRAATAPWAEMVAHVLADGIKGRYTLRTPLTNAKGRAAAAEVRARHAGGWAAQNPRVRQRSTRSAMPSDYRCPDCGGQVTNPRHVRCQQCIDSDPRRRRHYAGPGGGLSAPGGDVRPMDRGQRCRGAGRPLLGCGGSAAGPGHCAFAAGRRGLFGYPEHGQQLAERAHQLASDALATVGAVDRRGTFGWS